jgi:pyrroline-5-carboxylate reductase
MTSQIALVGAGKMGFAMLQGWAARGLVGAGAIVVDPAPAPEVAAFCAAHGMILIPQTPSEAASKVDCLVLAIKPQSLDAAAPALSAFVSDKTLALSILAGKSIANIRSRLPGVGAIVRAMPNTPAAIGRGVTGATAEAHASPAQREFADKLLAAVGKIVWLEDEGLIDAVTAVSGSGPAYVFYLAECMAAAGVKLGLPADVAAILARATVEGAGELMARAPETAPAQLRQNVTSPGGTTAAALEVLMADDGLEKLMTRALAAAEARGKALAG